MADNPGRPGIPMPGMGIPGIPGIGMTGHPPSLGLQPKAAKMPSAAAGGCPGAQGHPPRPGKAMAPHGDTWVRQSEGA